MHTYVSAVNRLPMPSYCTDMSHISTHRYIVVVQASHSLHEGHLDLLVGQGVSEDKILKAGGERGIGQCTVESGGEGGTGQCTVGSGGEGGTGQCTVESGGEGGTGRYTVESGGMYEDQQFQTSIKEQLRQTSAYMYIQTYVRMYVCCIRMYVHMYVRV